MPSDRLSHNEIQALNRVVGGGSLGETVERRLGVLRYHGLWAVSTVYYLEQVVIYNDELYTSLFDDNIGNQPDTSPTYWTKIPVGAGSISSLVSRVTTLEDTYVKATWFEQINSGTSGTLSIPSNSSIVLDQFASGVDALLSTVTSGQPPDYESVRDAAGDIVVTTLDGSGNWSLSGTPSSYPVAVIYVYRVKFKNFDYTKTLSGIELENHSFIRDQGGQTAIWTEKTPSDDTLRFDLGGLTPYIDAVKLNLTTGFIFNDDGRDVDFRIESDTHPDAFSIDGTTGYITLGALTASTVPYLDSGKELKSSAVTPTELSYLSGVTSAIQTQLNGKIGTTLTSAHILVGNGSNVAADVAVTGDITMSNTGDAQIATGAIVDADVNASAAIAFNKLAALTSANILVGNGSNVATSVSVSGEASLSSAGAVTLSNAAVIGKVLTGYVSTTGAIAATDTILTAIEKADGNLTLRVPNGTVGSVSFYGSATALTQDNSTFFWDNTNKRLGIGTNAPAGVIDLTSTTPSLHLCANNNATDSAAKVGYLGIRHYSSATEEQVLCVGFAANSSSSVLTLGGVSGTSAYNFCTSIAFRTAETNISTTSFARGIITSTGNFGIGTTSPNALLDVRLTNTGPGTVTVSAGGSTVTGTNTEFLNTFKVGNSLTVDLESSQTITAIASNTSLTVSGTFASNHTDVVYTCDQARSRFAVKGNGYIGVSQSTPTTKYSGASMFASADPRMEILTGTGAGTYQEFVAIRHTDQDVTAVLRRVGLTLHLSSESSAAQSARSGGIILDSSSANASSPDLSLIVADNKYLTISSAGLITVANRITGVSTPTGSSDAATKGYVDGIISPSGTVGSVVFYGSSTSLSQDNSNFFWDNTNKRLGIGINASLLARLSIKEATIGDRVVKYESVSAGSYGNPQYCIRQYRGTTTDNTNQTLATIATSSNTAYLVEARVVAVRTGGSAGVAGDNCMFIRTARCSNRAGTLSIQGVQASYTNKDQASWNCDITSSGTSIIVQINGNTNNNVEWHGTIILQETTYS